MPKPSQKPRPKIISWLFGKNLSGFRALLLTVPSSICIASMEAIIKSGFWTTYYSNDPIYLGLTVIIALIAGIIIYTTIYRLTEFLFGKWLPYFHALWEGFLAMLVFCLTSIVLVISILGYFFLVCKNSGSCVNDKVYLINQVAQHDTTTPEVAIIAIFMFIFICLIYEIEFHIRKYINPQWIVLGVLVFCIVASTGIFEKFWTGNPREITINTISEHYELVQSLAFSPNGEILASGSGDKTIKLWSLKENKEIGTLTGYGDTVTSLDFSPTGEYLAGGSTDATVKLWDVKRRIMLNSFVGHSKPVTAVDLNPNCTKILASAGMDGIIRRWNLESMEELNNWNFNGEISSMTLNPDGNILAVSFFEGNVELWDMENEEQITNLAISKYPITSIAFSPDGKTLATAVADNTIRLWNVATETEIANLSSHADYVLSLAFSPNGKILATAGRDHKIKLWNVDDWKEFATLSGHNANISMIKFSPDGNILASASEDKTVKLWNLQQLPIMQKKDSQLVVNSLKNEWCQAEIKLTNNSSQDNTNKKIQANNFTKSQPSEIEINSNTFRDAINQGTKATNLAKKAKTETEWNEVAQQWQKAIELMQEIPASDSNYNIAQDRVSQYQKNLDYAQQISADKLQQQAGISSYDQFFKQGVEEATSASFFVQTAKTKDEWGYVATLWNNAIANMKALPTNHPKYQIAQQKIIEYQKNLDYAKSQSK